MTPSVLTIHDLAYLHLPEASIKSHLGYLKRKMPIQVQKADHIAAVSRFTQLDIVTSFNCPATKIDITYNDVDARFQPVSDTEQSRFRDTHTNGRPFFLYLGSIHPRKNVDTLINAFELYCMKHPSDICLVLAGRWAWKSKKTQQLIRQSSVGDKIIILPNIDQQVYELVGSALAMVYLSLFEGFGMPILEAMRSGVAVITSRESAMSEVAGDAAIYVNPRDIENVTQAMYRIRSQPHLRQALIRAGLKQSSRFSWKYSSEILFLNLLKVARLDS